MFPIITKIPLFPVFGLVLGILLLVFGRKLFWLFVAAFGFMIGLNLASRYFSGSEEWVTLAIAIIGGLIGAALAVFVKRVAIAAVGFIAGGYITFSLMSLVNADFGQLTWVAWVVGGILGLIFLTFLFEWTLIILSSVVGAVMITQAIPLPMPVALGTILSVILVIVGMVVQGKIKNHNH